MVSFGFFQVQARKQRRREDSLLPTPLIVLSSLVIHLSRSSAIVLQGAGGFEASLLPERRKSLKALLLKYVDCFAWSYEEMPGLDPRSPQAQD